MLDDTIERLVDELSTARGDRYTTIEAQIIAMGAPAVPHLVRAQRAKRIERWTCFDLILKMGPDAYVPVLEAARDDNDEALAILHFVSNSGRPLPEAVPILVDVLQSADSKRLLCCMGTILRVHPLIEVHCPEQLPLFASATNRLLDLLGHENREVCSKAAQCLAVLKPAEPDVLAALLRVLKAKDLCKDSAEVYALIQAVGAHRAEAARAVPVLTEILQSKAPLYVRTQAAQELAHIGRAAASTVPLLEEYRDNTQPRFKSQRAQFKRVMNQIIAELTEASAPSMDKPRKGDPYLLDLINRMEQHHDGVAISTNSTTGKAYEEVRHLADASLAPKIGDLLDTRLNYAEFSHLVFILGCVTRNTGCEEGRRLILGQFLRRHRRKGDLNAIIRAAARCYLKEASPYIRRLMFEENGRYVSDALDYFKVTKDASAVDDIGRCLQEFPRHALLCVFALGDIGAKGGVQHLLNVTKLKDAPAKPSERELWYYAIRALGLVNAHEAVPDLIAMLSNRKLKRLWPSIIDALCRIGDERAFMAVLATLKHAIEAQAFSTQWSPGHRTLIVNGLDYLGKIGKRDDPEAMELVQSLRSRPIWNRLLEEERQFIRQWCGSGR